MRADSNIASLEVSGYLAEVLVGDAEPVKAARCRRGSTIAISRQRLTRRMPMSAPGAAPIVAPVASLLLRKPDHFETGGAR